MKKRFFILVKLGGSLITDKSKPLTARTAVIRRLGREIKTAMSQNIDLKIVLAHGNGSFGHIPAEQYGTTLGFSDEKGKFGACVTHHIAAKINRIVVEELLAVKLPVASVAPSSIFTARNGKPNTSYFDSIMTLISHHIIPVLYGDVIWDSKQGSSIFSGETSLGIVARNFLSRNWQIRRVIECGIEEGVLGQAGNVIPMITRGNFPDVSRFIAGSASTDVTGGMLHKVQEGLELAKHGVQTLIINGASGRLRNSLLGKPTIGTLIK